MDKRVERSRQQVLATAFDLLSAGGVGGFSVDEVARRSGVAKTTIYRHWPTREALVAEACWQMVAEQQEEAPDTGTVAGDIEAILGEIGRLLWSANWSSVLPSIIDAAERDPEFARIHSQIQHGHAAPLRAVLERAIGRGELSPGIDVSVTVAALLGPLFYRRWFSREPIDDSFVPTLVGRVVGPGTQSGPSHPAEPVRTGKQKPQ